MSSGGGEEDDIGSDDANPNEGAKKENPQAGTGKTGNNFDLEATFMNARGILVDEKQLELEKEYVMPTDVEIKSKYKMQSLKCRQKFDLA